MERWEEGQGSKEALERERNKMLGTLSSFTENGASYKDSSVWVILNQMRRTSSDTPFPVSALNVRSCGIVYFFSEDLIVFNCTS